MLVVILTILILVFLLFIKRKRRNRRNSCLVSCCKREGLTTPPKCSLVKAVYQNLINGLGKLDQKTFGYDGPFKALNNTCNYGNDVLGRCNKYNWFTDPMKNNDFTRLCCNGSTDCLNGATCINKKGKLAILTDEYSKIDPSTIYNDTNINAITDYCSLGVDIINNGCSVDTLHPQNNQTFKKYCCNNNDDLSKCSVNNVGGCIVNVAKFKNSSSGFSGWSERSPSSDFNAQLIRDFCSLGQKILNEECSDVNVINDIYFNKYCCNGSSDVTKCSISNIDDCIVNKAKFIDMDRNVSFLSPASVPYNMDEINEYCSLANTMKLKLCNGFDANSYKSYNSYCKN